jgi:ATP-dependent DNA helicase PIF1
LKTVRENCFFIDGPGGSGKSYLLNGLIKNLQIEGYKVLPCATTGIAADLLEGGRTVHSRFKVPLFIDK